MYCSGGFYVSDAGLNISVAVTPKTKSFAKQTQVMLLGICCLRAWRQEILQYRSNWISYSVVSCEKVSKIVGFPWGIVSCRFHACAGCVCSRRCITVILAYSPENFYLLGFLNWEPGVHPGVLQWGFLTCTTGYSLSKSLRNSTTLIYYENTSGFLGAILDQKLNRWGF